MKKPEKIRVVYTVPLHVGNVIEVPKGSKIIFYDPKKGPKR
jgi:hypothetical protein